MDSLLADAPLPVKLAAGMLKPLVTAFEGVMRESVADADDLLLDADRRLKQDARTATLSLGSVFSSASSSSSINGVVRKQITLQCQVIDRNGSAKGTALLNGSTQTKGKVGLATLRIQLDDGSVIDLSGGRVPNVGGADGVIDVDYSEA